MSVDMGAKAGFPREKFHNSKMTVGQAEVEVDRVRKGPPKSRKVRKAGAAKRCLRGGTRRENKKRHKSELWSRRGGRGKKALSLF